MSNGGNKQPSIDSSEHIGKEDGENIDAKRVGMYVWSSELGQWVASPYASPELGELVPFSYDYIAKTTDTLTDTYVYKTGGSTGTTVATVVVTFTDSTKSELSTVERT